MSAKYLTKEDFLAGIVLSPQDLEVEGLGTIQVRGLGLAELAEIRAIANENEVLYVLHGAHRGMVNPRLSLEDLEALGHGDPNKVSDIGKRVFELSGQAKKDDIDPLAGGGSSPPEVTEAP